VYGSHGSGTLGLIFCCLVIVIAVSGATAPAGAQDVPRIEAGPEISFFQVKGWTTDTGAGGHVAVALTPRIAIETRVRLFPADTLPVRVAIRRIERIISHSHRQVLERVPTPSRGCSRNQPRSGQWRYAE
jgi:hypothetical protein